MLTYIILEEIRRREEEERQRREDADRPRAELPVHIPVPPERGYQSNKPEEDSGRGVCIIDLCN